MAKSVKVNFLYNVLNTVMGLLFPLITFPYASRILLADGLGKVNYFISIISYVVLFTSIGIPIYGVREVARVRDDKNCLTRTTIEILLLNLILDIFGYISIAVMCFAIHQIAENLSLFLILSSTVLFTAIGCNWFYSGIEDFKGITLRSLVVRILSLAILFGFVHTKDDLIYYAIFYIASSVGCNVINFVLLRKYLDFSAFSFRSLDLFKHVRPAIAVFLFSIVTSIYLNLDKVMLGAITGNASVGYYTAASQLSHILLTVVVSLGTVLLPRSSNLIHQNQLDEFYHLSEKSYRFILMIAMPIVTGCIIMSPTLIRLFCGDSYIPSIQTLCVISPIILFIGMSQSVGMQILYPIGKIELVTYSTCVGAAVNLLLNIILIPLLAQDGAAISSVVAEFCVTMALFVIAKKYIPFKMVSSFFFNYLLASIVMMLVCYTTINLLEMNNIVLIIFIPILGTVIYSSQLYLTKDSLFFEMLGIAKNVISNYKRL